MIRRLLAPSARFVLAIGNEGGLLLNLAGGRITGRWQVAGHDDAALATLAAPLAATPKCPLVVVGDLLEQSYRKEAVARAADQAEPALTAAAAEARKAAGDSLLFSKRAERLIEEARLGQGRTPAVAATRRGMQAPAAAPPTVIHLSAIVYHAPDDWRVWLNGQSYTPAAQPRAIEILEVTAGAVRLTWRGGSEQRPRQVELQPNQSYLIASGEIIEGKLRRRLPASPSSPPAPGPSR